MNTPNWSHLPHDPQQFFELADGFDRKDLKRAYNTLIRQFKPEKFPDQFQRIRAAFESLDQQLRYGESFRIPSTFRAAYEWSAPTDANSAEQAESAAPSETSSNSGDSPTGQQTTQPAAQSPRETPKPLVEQVDNRSPEEIYSQLRKKTEKTPADYFALSIFSDIISNPEPNSFLKWLLAGIKKYPEDPGLCRLLAAFLKTEVTAKQAPGILSTVATLIPKDRFFYLTEGLWDVLLRDGDFQAFRATLATCEAKLMDHRQEARVAFYIHILPAALWIADPNWIIEITDFVNEHAGLESWQFSQDLDRLDTLRDYMKARPALLASGNEYLSQLDDVCRSYCFDEESEFDRRFLELAMTLSSNSKSLVEEFEFPVECQDDRIYAIWYRMDNEVANRHGVEDVSQEITTKEFIKRINKHLERIRIQGDSATWSTPYLSYTIIRITFLAMIFGMIFGPSFVLSLVTNMTFVMAIGYVLGLVLCGAVCYFALIPLWSSLSHRTWNTLYKTYVRAEVLEILSVSQIPFNVLVNLLSDDEVMERQSFLKSVRKFIVGDIALVIMMQCNKYRV